MALTFSAFRAANRHRLPQFRDAKGRLSHSEPDGSDWPLSQWSNAVLGELGEAANIIKKIERGDFTLDEAKAMLADELADVQTYLDLLAHRAGVDLGRATIDKFNRISERVKASTRLYHHELTYLASPHSHPDAEVREARWKAAVRAAAKLYDEGRFVFSPIAHSHHMAIEAIIPPDFQYWRDYDRHMLTLCDSVTVLRLDGWEQSKGIAEELVIAAELRLPVTYMDPV